ISADKLHATISRSGLSTRAKDIYDLSKILHQCKKVKLKLAVEYTFKKRGDTIPNSLFDTLTNLDTKSLERNWKKVENFGETVRFEESWELILNFFETFKP